MSNTELYVEKGGGVVNMFSWDHLQLVAERAYACFTDNFMLNRLSRTGIIEKLVLTFVCVCGGWGMSQSFPPCLHTVRVIVPVG